MKGVFKEAAAKKEFQLAGNKQLRETCRQDMAKNLLEETQNTLREKKDILASSDPACVSLCTF